MTGKGFDAVKISNSQYESVETFFLNNGFEIDRYNLADGTVVGLTGYKKDSIVCTAAGGVSGYKEAEGQWVPSEFDKQDVEVKCGKLENSEGETVEWKSYKSEKYGYSFKYPQDCFYGPLPGYCKQKPPEERSQECLCYLNGENPDSVSLGTFTGPKDNLNGASFVVFHSVFVDSYRPPAGTNLIQWLKEKFPGQENIPDEANTEVDGIPAARVHTPRSPQAYSQEDIYFIKGDKLFKIGMLDVDNENNRALYDQILSTFRVLE